MAKAAQPKAQKVRKTTPKPIDVRPMQTMKFASVVDAMDNEVASILSDYVRQYVGVASGVPTATSGIITNWDRVLNTQTYQDLAWYDLYAELEKDTHVAGILASAKLNVAGLDWDMEPYGAENASRRDKSIAEFVKQNLLAIDNFQQDIYELMGALGQGFAVQEVIWQTDKSGARVVEKLMNRPQRRFQFDAVSRAPKLRTMDDPWYGKPLPDKKFIVHRVSSTWENPFGDALDQSLYWMWLFKRVVLKFWMTNLETATAPIPIVKHPSNAATPVQEQALAIAKQIRSGAYGRMPANMELVWAEASNMMAANVSYMEFINLCNDEMTKCVQGQTLTTEGSARSGAGSKALGQVHQVTQDQRDIFRAKGLEATLNSTLIRWMVDENFASVDGYPRFKFDLDEGIDRKTEADVIKTLADAGYKVKPEEVEMTFGYDLEETEPVEINPTEGVEQ